jgi:16S rRNA (uracil1498-N3)-methyltransferase
VSAPVFVVARDQLAVGPVVLDGAEGRHAVTVTRLAPGEGVVLVDGAGRRGTGTVSAVSGKDSLFVDVMAVVDEAEPSPRLVVVQALAKGDRGETAVETMTEVGVDEVIPWTAARCITRWNADRADKALARWRSTAQAAAKQSRRARFPLIAPVASTVEVAGRLAAAATAVVLHEEAAEPLSSLRPPGAGEIVVVVGPEGGVTPEELVAFAAAGASAYRMGATVLRTSTAGTAALAVLLSRTDRWA